MKPIRIEARNIEELSKANFPPGVTSKTAKANYALSVGLKLLTGNQAVQPGRQGPNEGDPVENQGVKQTEASQSIAV